MIEGYNFAYLDEQTKRMIRRALLKAVAIPGYQVPFAEAVKAATGLPTMAVGLITDPAHAEALLVAGKADFIALARGLLYDPRWGWHAAAHLGASVSAPPQYWRSQPPGLRHLFDDVVAGVR